MDKIKSIDYEGVQIPLAIPVEMDLPTFVYDDRLKPQTRQYALLFAVIQEQLKKLMEKINEGNN